jgi:hypothetical protein
MMKIDPRPGVPLIHEHTQLSLILNLNKLLAAIGRLWERSVILRRREGEGGIGERTKEMFYITTDTLARALQKGRTSIAASQQHRAHRGRLTNFILTWESGQGDVEGEMLFGGWEVEVGGFFALQPIPVEEASKSHFPGEWATLTVLA